MKTILVSFVAILTLVFLMNTVMADVVIDEVSIDGVELGDPGEAVVAGFPGETVAVKVRFTSGEDAEDVRIKLWIDGYRSDIYETTERFDILDGSTYVKKFSFELPDVEEMDDLDEELTLNIRIATKADDLAEEKYTIRLQKDAYDVEVLSIDAPSEVIAGSVVPIDVVVKNTGRQELEDVFVIASIPDLGIEKKIYLGDIDELDEKDIDDGRDLNREDTAVGKIYLTVPTGVQSGIYALEVEAYNYDFSETVKQAVVIKPVKSDILSGAAAKDVAIGETTVFDVVVVNSGDRIATYTISTEDVKGLIIEVDEPVISIPAGLSKTVKVKVKATDSADQGTHTLAVNVNSGDELVKAVNFSVNVEKGTAIGIGSTALVLTVVLAIVFVVLLIVLIVLLTKKPAQIEDLGETSYY